MEYIYLLVCGSEWEDIIVFLSEEDAIKASIENPNDRVEIFSKKENSTGYRPKYNYYENGKYIETS